MEHGEKIADFGLRIADLKISRGGSSGQPTSPKLRRAKEDGGQRILGSKHLEEIED